MSEDEEEMQQFLIEIREITQSTLTLSHNGLMTYDGFEKVISDLNKKLDNEIF